MQLRAAAWTTWMLALAAMGFSNTAFGHFWIYIGETGSKPNRVAYYAYEGWLLDKTDSSAKAAEIMRDHNPKTIDTRLKALKKTELQVVQIYEAPKAPVFVSMNMLFDCSKRQYQITFAHSIARNRVPSSTKRAEWRAVPSGNWLDRAHFVACEEDVWRKAGQEDLNSSRKSGKGEQPRMKALGLGFVGEWGGYLSELQVDNFTWEKVWTDGSRPPFNDNRTPEEEKIYRDNIAKNKEMREQIDLASKQADGMIAALDGQIKGMDEESKFQEEIANNFRKHKSKYYGTFSGLTEEQLVDVRGVPTSSSTNGALRSIVYAYVTDNRQKVEIRDGAGNLVGTDVVGQVLNCGVTFKLRVGGNRPEFRVVDYVVDRDMNSGGIASCQ
jgi:hypothetical protein